MRAASLFQNGSWRFCLSCIHSTNYPHWWRPSTLRPSDQSMPQRSTRLFLQLHMPQGGESLYPIPFELDLFRHVETPKTLPKGNERLIGDAQCSPAIAKGAAWLQLQSPTQFSGVIEEVVEWSLSSCFHLKSPGSQSRSTRGWQPYTLNLQWGSTLAISGSIFQMLSTCATIPTGCQVPLL